MKRTGVFTLAKPGVDCVRTKCSYHSLHVASFKKCDAPGLLRSVLSSGSHIICSLMTESKQF